MCLRLFSSRLPEIAEPVAAGDEHDLTGEEATIVRGDAPAESSRSQTPQEVVVHG